jgi:hypothetical protein
MTVLTLRNIYKNLLFLIILSSCGKSFNDSSKNKVNQNSPDTVEVKVLEGKNIGEYSVEFAPINDSRYSIIKHDLFKGETLELAVGVSGKYEDKEVSIGCIYKYEIGEYIGDKSFSILFEKEIKIPIDIQINENEERSLDEVPESHSSEGHSVFDINRISFSKNAKLVTEGKKIHLKIKKLLSFQGIITTFKENTKAKDGVTGRSGNEISIDIEYANGDLLIILRGENGGDGLRPNPLGEAGRGKAGAKGAIEGITYIYKYLGVQGSSYEEQTECIQYASKGEVGEKGQTGLTGNSGLSGGNSGVAIIFVKQSSNFKINYQFINGIGGEGSIGGDGGLGGLGGEPGREKVIEIEIDEETGGGPSYTSFNQIPEYCTSEFGSEGPLGEIGQNGQKGNVGNTERICFKKNENEKLECFTESSI